MNRARNPLLTVICVFGLAGVASAQTDPGIAYAVITDGTSASVTPSVSQNPSGLAVTETRSGTGVYAVVFTGTNLEEWSLMADTQGPASNYCLAADNSSNTSEIVVNCFNSTGAPADSPFAVNAIGPKNLKNIAYALVSPTGTYFPNFSFNPAGTIVPAHLSTGHYSVQFQELAGTSGGTVQVSAGALQNTTSARCFSGSWGGGDFTASIFCLSPNGTPEDVNVHFAIIPAGATPAGAAYVYADQPSNSGYTTNPLYTSAPGVVQVSRTGTGVYNVTFAGLSAAAGGFVRATAVDSSGSSGNYCHVTSLSVPSSAPGSLQAGIACFQGVTGAPADSQYTILVFSPSFSLTCSPTTGPVTTNVSYSSTCTVAGGTSPYTFVLPTNGVPAGLNFAPGSNSITISGTPTQTGSYNFTITVQDSSSPHQSASFTFSGSVAAGTSAPPALTSLNPSSATAGGAAFNLIVNGTNFTQTAQILWNGTALNTSFSSATQLSGAVPASLIATSGSATVTVSQGGVTTSGLTFTINPAGTGTPPGTPPPAILNNGIVSSASFTPAQSPGGPVAQGSIFSIFGSALGPPATAQQTSFPLGNTLSGVSITVTSGSTQLNAIPVFVSPTLINAIMPSATPAGRVSVQVTYNGAVSNMSPVIVVPNAPSIYTSTGAGIGPSISERVAGRRTHSEYVATHGDPRPDRHPVAYGAGPHQYPG